VKSLAVAACAALSLAAVTPAHAQQARPGPYGGINFSQIGYDQSGASAASLTSFGGVLGTVLGPHFAVEVRAGIGLNDDQITVGPTTAMFDLNSYFGGYLKGILPLAPRFGIYGLAGATIGKFTGNSGATYLTRWESDFSYGAGVEFGLAPTTSLGIEWLRMFEGSGYNLDAVSVGLNFRF
jgi:opacity protein-like surface antigen